MADDVSSCLIVSLLLGSGMLKNAQDFVIQNVSDLFSEGLNPASCFTTPDTAASESLWNPLQSDYFTGRSQVVVPAGSSIRQ